MIRGLQSYLPRPDFHPAIGNVCQEDLRRLIALGCTRVSCMLCKEHNGYNAHWQLFDEMLYFWGDSALDGEIGMFLTFSPGGRVIFHEPRRRWWEHCLFSQIFKEVDLTQWLHREET